jgi:hypothetical protein
MRKKSMLAAAGCAVALAAASASSAFAGEVIGPSDPDGGSPRTAAPDNANSICAFSGLNDKPLSEDPMDPPGIVQSYGFSVVSQGFTALVPSPGDTVEEGGCRGGSNPDRL